MYENNFILRCNGMKKTGGPMATLQLAECLLACGNNIIIWYDSIDAYKYFEDWHKKYLSEKSKYIVTDDISQLKNKIFILTESSFNDIKNISKDNKIWVYMQSVDNCIIFGTSASRLEGTFRILKNCIKNFNNSYANRWTIVRDRIEFIFSQSAYSNNFLSNLDANIPYLYIGDFIDKEKYNKPLNRLRKYSNLDSVNLRVAFNPSKGKILHKLAKFFSKNITFIPIINVNPENILDFLSSADCYVDFGGQPGKDRLPREAILSGIPSFQFLRGAAVNGSDFPCPIIFRLNFYNVINFESRIKKGLKLNNKTIHSARIADILSEKDNFYSRINHYLNTYYSMNKM
ncbi:hypothetical protein [Polynucleobacter corsicus]|uniref:hypothetical protein n=1 Tax=Polynucleobacter corsicus TaxID=2081042 RepID=UPI001BFE6951|nr:hypothetical protein [Polynucleobacter corsicus]QWE18971.1 hypothetical protein C2747_01660 [Polynucleobacter corsicus]